eukprot:scaffold466_cov238-Pinguiococcus_pyrenoidosus.AAC.2
MRVSSWGVSIFTTRPVRGARDWCSARDWSSARDWCSARERRLRNRSKSSSGISVLSYTCTASLTQPSAIGRRRKTLFPAAVPHASRNKCESRSSTCWGSDWPAETARLWNRP